MALFIATEGLDGAGTSTQSKAIAAALRDRGESTVVTFEPSEGTIGRMIRKYLAGDLVSSGNHAEDRKLLAYLFAADRQDHLARKEDGIEASLAAGRHVVCARYVMSSYAYEGDDAEELAFVKSLNEGFRVPDLVVYLDGSVDLSLERLGATRDRLDIFENREKLERVREGYLRAMETWTGPVLICDASRPAAEITQEVIDVLSLGS